MDYKGRIGGKAEIGNVKLLNEKARLYDSLFNDNIDGILVLDINGNLKDGNPAIEKLSGYTLEELKRTELASLVAVEDLERKYAHTYKAVEGEPQVFNLSIFNKSGQRMSVIVKMIPIIVDHEIIGIFEIIKDVTEAKKMEMYIHQSDKLSAIGELAAGVAHEIRNPLTSLKGFLQILKPEINSKYIEIMEAELERINLIVSEFLVLSKPQMEHYSIYSINSIINKVIFLLESQANLNNIQVHTKLENAIPNIRCEENQLKQVFINLLKNGMEAMPNGGNIYIEASLEESKNSYQYSG
jgi:PAS domain S-box-containing protein